MGWRCRALFNAVVLAGVGVAQAAAAQEQPLARHPIVAAVAGSRCHEAVDLLNAGIKANDAQALLLGGRMLDGGFCVKEDPAAATLLFERATELGNRDAGYELAAKLGLGQGVKQDYEFAGVACRKAGADPARTVSNYTLGYACTVRGLAGKIAREQLPRDAVQPGAGGTVLVEFRPASAKTDVTPGPQFAMRAEASTGSNLRRQRNDVRWTVEESWRLAVQRVPKPDYPLLADVPLRLQLDFEFTNPDIENRSAAMDFVRSRQPTGTLFSPTGPTK